MEKNLNLSKLSHEELLTLYKKCEEYIIYLEKEKKEKGTEE